jgi:hypothetical protein
MTPRQLRMLEAIRDDPGGLTHSIWAELGIDPIPPISAEELWLLDKAMATEDDVEAQVIAGTKVWDRDSHGQWVKVWSIPETSQRTGGGNGTEKETEPLEAP